MASPRPGNMGAQAQALRGRRRADPLPVKVTACWCAGTGQERQLHPGVWAAAVGTRWEMIAVQMERTGYADGKDRLYEGDPWRVHG